MDQMDSRVVGQQGQASDEIDLRQLFLNMWAVRHYVVLAVLVVSLCYWGLWAVKQLLSPTSLSYSRVVQFTFKGAEQAQYPNGTPFRIADVVAPSVLGEAYDINGLGEQEVPEAAFVQSFNIQPYAPDYNLIVEKYQAAMKRKGITGEEITELQAKMKSELTQASARSALISFKAAKGVALSEEIVNKVLLDVPRLWAEKAITKDGVLDLDLTLYSSKMFDRDRFDSLDYMIAIDLVQDNVRLIQQNIKVLTGQPNGKLVRDEETGYRLPDLEKSISDVVAFDLQQLITPIQDLGVTKDQSVVRLYYQYKIKELEREKAFELSQAELIRQALDEYARSVSGRGGNANTATAGVAQLGDEFLDRVIDLTQKGGDLEYRQSLTNKMLVHNGRAAEIDYEISEMNAVVEGLSGRGEQSEDQQRYVALLERSFPAILDKLQGYVEVTNRLYSKLSRENIGYSGMLYKVGGSSQLMVAGSALSKRDLLIFALLFFMALFGTMVVAMMIRWLKGGSRVSS